MGVFVAAIAKKNSSVKQMVLSKIKNRELESNLNTEYDVLDVFFSKNERACVVDFATDCILYSAEDSFFIGEDGYVAIQGDILTRHTDYSNDDFLKASDVYSMLSLKSYRDFKEETSGTYSIVSVNNDGDVLAFNDSISFEHLYYAENNEYVFISNRIRLIRCFLGKQAHVDLYTLSNIVLIGSVVGTGTSIQEIKRLPQGSCINVRNGKLEIKSDPLFFYNDPEVTQECQIDFTGFVKKELTVCANRMAAALKHVDNFSFALSGGKDSRALLAMLMSIKPSKEINVFTNGYENHPDVVAAKLISEHYGFHHTINIPKPSAQLSVNQFMQKLMGSVFQTDGMIGLFNAKENTGCNLMNVSFPGHVNEVFRRFAKPSVKINSLDDIKNYYKTIHLYDPLEIMTDELLSKFDNQFSERAQALDSSELSLEDNVDTYFICDRLPNWSGYLLRQDGYAQDQIQILNNDRLIKAFYMNGGAELREIELLHFLMIKDFSDKWLVETPFAVQQWNPNLLPYASGANISNKGIPLPDNIPLHGTWQHMINNSADLKIKLFEILLSFPDSEIWQLYNKDKVLKSLMMTNISYTPMLSLYGFLNMFFYNHNIEIPMKLKSDMRRTHINNVLIKNDSGSGIYKYDNNCIHLFKSYDELISQGYKDFYRIPASPYAIRNIEKDK